MALRKPTVSQSTTITSATPSIRFERRMPMRAATYAALSQVSFTSTPSGTRSRYSARKARTSATSSMMSWSASLEMPRTIVGASL